VPKTIMGRKRICVEKELFQKRNYRKRNSFGAENENEIRTVTKCITLIKT